MFIQTMQYMTSQTSVINIYIKTAICYFCHEHIPFVYMYKKDIINESRILDFKTDFSDRLKEIQDQLSPQHISFINQLKVKFLKGTASSPSLTQRHSEGDNESGTLEGDTKETSSNTTPSSNTRRHSEGDTKETSSNTASSSNTRSYSEGGNKSSGTTASSSNTRRHSKGGNKSSGTTASASSSKT